jgi:RNA-splicing ligase RtcB
MNLKIFAETVEQEAIDQVMLLLNQPSFKDCKVRIMPDTHAGKGCVIGFTADLGDKVIPNIVGVDLGCGMLTVELGKIDIDFEKLDKVIHDFVPSGRNVHEGRIVKFPEVQDCFCYRELKDTKRIERSIGTLGGGNHFIEVDIDNDGNYYFVVHTGSRNFGKQVADYYQNLAYELLCGKDKLLEEQNKIIEEYKASGRRSEIQAKIAELKRNFKASDTNVPKELCYLSGEYRQEYLHDMQICQRYAVKNRETMFAIISEKMGWNAISSFQTIHNYIELETNMIRKGAISAKKDEVVLIPINMRDGAIIGIGKGNEDWNFSAPHGAGRLMSRTKAKETFSLDEYKNTMNGIYTTSVTKETIDEAPMAYKPMEEIIRCIEPTVDVVKIIKPVYNFKASE